MGLSHILRVGRGTSFPPFLLCPFTSSSFALCTFPLFPFLIRFTYLFLLSIPSLSTRIVPLRFQAGDRRRRPNLDLVCSVHFVLPVLLSHDLFWCFVIFGLVYSCSAIVVFLCCRS